MRWETTDLSKICHPVSGRESFLALNPYHLLKDKGRLKYSGSQDKTCCWRFRICFYARSVLFYCSRNYFLWHTHWLLSLDLCGNKESLTSQSISWLITKHAQSISWLITKCKLKHETFKSVGGRGSHQYKHYLTSFFLILFLKTCHWSQSQLQKAF